MEDCIDTAWMLRTLVLPELGLSDLNSVEEAVPHLLGPSCRKEKEKKKRMQLIGVFIQRPDGVLIYYRNTNILKMCISMAGIRFAA